MYEVIKDYLNQNPGIGFAQLKKAFPDSLRNKNHRSAKNHVVEMESSVRQEDRFARYFKEPLICTSGAVVVSSQWGIGNITPFIERAKQMGYTIEEVVNNKK